MVNKQRRNGKRQWRGDFRVICDCQRHSKNRSLWRRGFRVATRFAAVMVSVPLAFGALDINAAMNLNVVGVDPN